MRTSFDLISKHQFMTLLTRESIPIGYLTIDNFMQFNRALGISLKISSNKFELRAAAAASYITSKYVTS